jgi:predicted RNase H-like HicB family nuclease
MKYVVMIEPTKNGFSAYCPDIPSCTATGSTASGAKDALAAVIAFHIESLIHAGFDIPAANFQAETIEIAV